MQLLDQLILETWKRLKRKLLRDPNELATRLARRAGRSFCRPRREWCLAIRACDRRIGVSNACITPEYAMDLSDPEHPGQVVEHTVTLTAPLVRELCRPVAIMPGGEIWDDAARKLGTTYMGLTHSRIAGALDTRHVKALAGRVKTYVPIVSSQNTLDPCSGRFFAMPSPFWTGHEYVSARVPNDLVQIVTRVPVYRPTASRHQYAENAHPEMAEPPARRVLRLPARKPDYVWYKWTKSGEFLGEDPRYWRKSPSDPGKVPPAQPAKRKYARKPAPSRARGSLVFRGWRWLCPCCGKAVRTLYCPAPPTCILEDEWWNLRSKAAAWPEIEERVPGIRLMQLRSRFACVSCLDVASFCSIAPHSWNELVSHMSSGLLRGGDIPKPGWFLATLKRKKPYRPVLNREAPKRQKVLELLLKGYSAQHIATEMNLRLHGAYCHIHNILRRENVSDRTALLRKFGSTAVLEPTRAEISRARRNQQIRTQQQGKEEKRVAV